jgi:hypothetical protein
MESRWARGRRLFVHERDFAAVAQCLVRRGWLTPEGYEEGIRTGVVRPPSLREMVRYRVVIEAEG